MHSRCGARPLPLASKKRGDLESQPAARRKRKTSCTVALEFAFISGDGVVCK